MRAILVSLALVVAVILPIQATVSTEMANAQSTATASASLVPFNNSGIWANINFEQDPALPAGSGELRVTGKAQNMVPYRQYVTLVYGVNTVATGPNACGRDATLNFEQMLVAEWLPISGTNRTLTGSKFTVNLNQIKTVSVREINPPVLPNVFKDLPPQAFQLRACGLINKKP